MQHNIYTILLGLGTIAMNAVFVLSVIALMTPAWRERLVRIVNDWGLMFIVLIAVGCFVGSLFVEFVLVLPPCHLCWWQRIFLYPIAFIGVVAFLKNVSMRTFADYVLALAIPGAGIALYQHLLQTLPSGTLLPCSATNECAVRSIFEFGYITMPFMALSAFGILILFALIARLSPEQAR